VNVLEIVLGETIDDIYIVMEFVEHDLKNLMQMMKNPFVLSEVKTIMLQLVLLSEPLIFIFFFYFYFYIYFFYIFILFYFYFI